ncbi:MAG: class I SAM-dependent methyltransferase [Elusimicrobiota bacterium]
MVKKVKTFFSKRAKIWDKIHKPCDFSTALKISLIPKNTQRKTVLDVGCGTGIMLPFLIARFKKVFACDISPEMVKIARKKYPLAEIYTIDFEKKHFFPHNFFDVVIIYNAFPHFAGPLSACYEAFRILKNGGLLIISHSLIRKEINRIHKKAGKAVEKDLLPDDNAFKIILSNSGFRNITIREEEDFIITAIKKYN